METQDTEQEQGAEQADLQEEQPVEMTEGETYDIPKDENTENNEQNEQAEPSEDAQQAENAEHGRACRGGSGGG